MIVIVRPCRILADLSARFRADRSIYSIVCRIRIPFMEATQMCFDEKMLAALCIARSPKSVGEKQICSFIEQTIRKLGLPFLWDVFCLNFPMPLQAMIEFDNCVIPAQAYPNTRCTGSEGVWGRLVYFPRISEAVDMKVEQAIVMTDDPFDEHCNAILAQSDTVGVITHDWKFTQESHAALMPHEPHSDRFTVLKINSKDAIKLMRTGATNIKMYYLNKVKKITSKNLYTYLPGAEDSKEIIMCAHYDTVSNSPGALDNLSGVLTLLKLLEMLTSVNRKTNIRFCWFGAEELGNAGSQYFVSKYKNKDTTWQCVINIDAVDCILGCDELYYHSPNKDLLDCLNIPQQGLRLLEKVYGGDNRSFENEGIDSLTFSRGGSFGQTIQHSRHDTLENAGITAKSLQRVADRIMNTIYPLIKV